ETALQERAKTFDQLGGPGGEIGQGALSDPAILAKALAQQDGRGRAAIGDRFNVHGATSSTSRSRRKAKFDVLHGYTLRHKRRKRRRKPSPLRPQQQKLRSSLVTRRRRSSMASDSCATARSVRMLCSNR